MTTPTHPSPPGLRTVITSPTLEYGGAERQRVLLAGALADRGVDAELRLLQGAGPLQQQVDPRVRVRVEPWWRPERPRLRGGGDPTLLVTGTTQIELAHGIAWRATHPGDRWVVANHHPAAPDRGVFPPRAVAMMRRADGMLHLAESHRVEHLRHQRVDRGRYWVVPNGIDPAPAPRSEVVRSGPPRLVSVGRLVEHKQNALLVGALASLADLPWQLDVWGDGPDRAAVEAAVPPALRDRVRLRGWCDDVPAALAEAELFCLPSRFEAQPMVVLEAMAAGVPVVASSVASLPEVLADGAGVLVQPPTVERWTAVLRELLTDPGRLAALGRAGRRRQQERYSVQAMTDGYLRVAREVLGRG